MNTMVKAMMRKAIVLGMALLMILAMAVPAAAATSDTKITKKNIGSIIYSARVKNNVLAVKINNQSSQGLNLGWTGYGFRFRLKTTKGEYTVSEDWAGNLQRNGVTKDTIPAGNYCVLSVNVSEYPGSVTEVQLINMVPLYQGLPQFSTKTWGDIERYDIVLPLYKKTYAATKVSLNSTRLKLRAGQTKKLTATVLPAKTTNKTLTWTSSNTKVCTVKNGKIVAKKAGTAVITVKTANGKKATCMVTVKKAA